MKTLRLLLLPVLAAFALGQTPNAEGDWSGTLDVGQAKLRLALHIVKGADGAFKSTIDSLDQGAMGIPVTTTTISGDSITLDLPNLQAGYKAKLSADGATISGEWTQMGQSRPLEFKRVTAEEKAAAQSKGKPLTADERAFLIGHLERSEKSLAAATAGLTEAQYKFKEAPERWSIIEITEHLALIEDLLFDFATKKILAVPPSAAIQARTPADLKAADEKILSTSVDRSQKGKAPEQGQPTGRYPTVDAALAAVKEKRAKSIEYARATQDDLRNHGSAAGGSVIDVYQYLLILAGHMDRHILQINEVKAATGYPK